MNKRQQLQQALKNPHLEHWQREQIHQHLFHLDQQELTRVKKSCGPKSNNASQAK